MSDPAAIAREYFEAWNRRDWAKIRSLMHPDYSYMGGDGERQTGQEAGIAVAQMFASALPDGKVDVQTIHVAGDVAITEFIGSGTHNGDLMGIAPTGRHVSMPVCNVIEIRDGMIYAEREYMDMMHMMEQLGVAPVPTTV
ncbi:MAG: DUF4440 domain-containing protein [Gemmatimonadales bacterium]|nr:DUF4440 domain-containing protein [Gemmatimonadales bacterium]